MKSFNPFAFFVTSLYPRLIETYEAEEEKFIHLEMETENFLPIYLESELQYLHNRELFGDGTWSLCRNLPNRMQVYIFSVSMNQLGKTFSYPVFLFLMKKREQTLRACNFSPYTMGKNSGRFTM